jgi:hypothetical protein
MTALDAFLAHRDWHHEHPDAPVPSHELTHNLALEIYLAGWEPLCQQCNPLTEEEFLLGGARYDDGSPPGKSYRDWAAEATVGLPVMREGYCPTCLIDGIAACLNFIVGGYEFDEESALELMWAGHRGRCEGGKLPPLICSHCGKPIDDDDDGDEEMAA